MEFAAAARKAAAAGSELSEAENTKAYKSRKAAETSRRRWQERDSRKTALDQQEHESKRGEEKAVAWDSRDALVQVANLLNKCIDATSWKDCRIGLYAMEAIIDEVKTGSYDQI